MAGAASGATADAMQLALESVPAEERAAASGAAASGAAASGAAGAASAGGPTADESIVIINNKKKQPAVCDEDLKEILREAGTLTACGLNRLAQEPFGRTKVRLFSAFLQRKHGLHIVRVDELVNATSVVRAVVVTLGVRQPAEKRRCVYDGNDWTFAETLEWVYNEGGGCYEWALGMWGRDFC